MNKVAIQKKLAELNNARNAIIARQSQLKQDLEKLNQQEWALTGAFEVLQQIMVESEVEGEGDAELPSELQLFEQNPE